MYVGKVFNFKMPMLKLFSIFLCVNVLFISLACRQIPPIELSKLPSADKLIFKTKPGLASNESQVKSNKSQIVDVVSKVNEKLSIRIISPIPKIVREGRTLFLDAKTEFAQGTVVYTWSLLEKKQSYVDNYSYLKFEVPFIENCDAKFTLQVTAEDEAGQTADDEIIINVSRVWCTFTAGLEELSNNTITSLSLSDSGTLWVGTANGLSWLNNNLWYRNYSSDKFNYVNALTARKLDNSDDDEIYVNFCLSANHKCKGAERIIVNNNNLSLGFNWIYEVVTSLVFDQNGNLFAGALDAGVSKIKQNSIINGVERYIRQHNVVAIVVDFYGANLFGTTSGAFAAGKGLYWQNQNSLKGYWIGESIWPSFPKEDITSLARDGANLYVGFDNQLGQGGLLRLIMQKSKGTKSKNWYVYRKSEHTNISSDDIRHIAIGKRFFAENQKKKLLRSHVWVATGTGLNRFVPSLTNSNSGTFESAQFKTSAVKNRGGLATDDLSVLLYDQNTDTLWIGTNGGGLTRLRVGLLE